jgi:hypothetical protein
VQENDMGPWILGLTVLGVTLLGLLPIWRHSKAWGSGPSTALALLVLVMTVALMTERA